MDVLLWYYLTTLFHCFANIRVGCNTVLYRPGKALRVPEG